MRALPEALAAAGADAGVRFHYCSNVTELERSAGRIIAVRRSQGQRIACDAVVLTTELPQTYQLLGRAPQRFRALRASLSAVVVYAGCRSVSPAQGTLAHHPIRVCQASSVCNARPDSSEATEMP